jgi:hypothetical protein
MSPGASGSFFVIFVGCSVRPVKLRVEPREGTERRSVGRHGNKVLELMKYRLATELQKDT